MGESNIHDNIKALISDVKRRKLKGNIFVLLSNNSRGRSLYNLKSSSKAKKTHFCKSFSNTDDCGSEHLFTNLLFN